MVAALLVLLFADLGVVKGDLRPYRLQQVYAPDTGFVQQVLVTFGDTVREGQLLAVLAPRSGFGDPIRVTAPMSGTISMRYVQTGVLAGPGARHHEVPLFDIEDRSRLRAVAPVPRLLPAETKIECTVAGRRITGTLERTVTRAGILFAEVVLNNSDGSLKPGGEAELAWPAEGSRQ